MAQIEKRIEREKAELVERDKRKNEKSTENNILWRIVAQNNDGTIKLGNRQFWASAFARKKILLKDGKEISTKLGAGTIENVSYNERTNSFAGTLVTKENKYYFEIDAETSKIIRKDSIKSV